MVDGTDDLAECIDATHAAALGTAPWEALLESMARAFPGTKVSLASEQPEPLRNIGVVSHGYEAALIHDYVEHYSRINPWTPHWKRIPILTAAISDDVLPSAQMKQHEFYEFIARIGEAESAAGIKLFETDNSFAALNVHYGSRQAADYNVSIPAFLNALAPHLNLAVQISARVAALSEPAPTLERVVQQFQTAAFLVGPGGVLLEVNGAGRDLLEEGQVARLQDGERLWIAESGARFRLTTLTTADDQPKSVPARTAVHGSAWRFLAFGSGDLDRRIAWMPKPKKWLLALHEPPPARPSIHDRAQRFGLTPQETRVAAAIVEGERVDAVAHSLGIASATVRQHLKSIFAKTDTHRQAELVGRLVHSDE